MHSRCVFGRQPRCVPRALSHACRIRPSFNAYRGACLRSALRCVFGCQPLASHLPTPVRSSMPLRCVFPMCVQVLARCPLRCVFGCQPRCVSGPLRCLPVPAPASMRIAGRVSGALAVRVRAPPPGALFSVPSGVNPEVSLAPSPVPARTHPSLDAYLPAPFPVPVLPSPPRKIPGPLFEERSRRHSGFKVGGVYFSVLALNLSNWRFRASIASSTDSSKALA